MKINCQIIKKKLKPWKLLKLRNDFLRGEKAGEGFLKENDNSLKWCGFKSHEIFSHRSSQVRNKWLALEVFRCNV